MFIWAGVYGSILFLTSDIRSTAIIAEIRRNHTAVDVVVEPTSNLVANYAKLEEGVTESQSDEALFPTNMFDDRDYYYYSYGYDDALDSGGDEHDEEPGETSFERDLYDEQLAGLLMQSMFLPIG